MRPVNYSSARGTLTYAKLLRGPEAIAVKGRLRPDLIVPDLLMPEMNGLDVPRSCTVPSTTALPSKQKLIRISEIVSKFDPPSLLEKARAVVHMEVGR